MSKPNARIQTVEEMWKDFAKAIQIDQQNCSQTQWQEMRRAFFGGTLAMFTEITGPMTELTDEDAFGVLDDFKTQFAHYSVALAMGQA